MPLESVFSLASSVVLLGWLALAALPYRLALAKLVAVVVALALASLYAALIGAFWGEGKGGFGSLADLSALFANPALLLGGWVHYLAFDLLVGTWEREEAAAIGLSRWLLLPCLGLTFMFGPVGWLLFMAMRFVRKATSSQPDPATST